MRRVEVSVPAGKLDEVAQVVFASGISEFSVVDKVIYKVDGPNETKHVVDMNVATPDAKAFVGELARAPFFDRKNFHISIREPRSNLTSESRRDMTRPLAAPILDIDQELWQFTHITPSFVLRIFIASLLLAYGMIEENWLFMAAGLIFLPFMPLVLAFSYGSLTSEKRLVGYAAVAFAVATVLIAAASAVVALLAEPPMLFEHFPPMLVGIVFSLCVGVAGALSMADDAGHRQLVGLAAASQLALLPAWFGISLVYGFSADATEKVVSFGANAIAITVGSMVVYACLSARRETPKRHASKPRKSGLAAAEKV